jgi:two-component system sensor histidine kinase BarA
MSRLGTSSLVPILVMASTVDRNELRALHQQGVRAVLPKAVRRQTLYRELCRFINGDAVNPLTPTGKLVRRHPPRRSEIPADAPTVLVVDDNHINRKLVSTILSNHRVHVLEAEDGQRAVEIATDNDLDLIFMDIQMPTMSGETAARKIFAQTGRRKTPLIVALTANAMPGERERLLALGMDDCLIKPITESQVVRILQNVSPQHAHAARPLAATAAADSSSLQQDLRDLLLPELFTHREAIQSAIRSDNAEQLRDRIHTLHGAAAVCQLTELKTACAALEATLNRGVDERDSLEALAEPVLQEIETLIRQNAGTPIS